MRVKKFNQEVLYCDEKVVKVSYRDIASFKRSANKNKRKRIRLCTHKNIRDRQQEMLIVHRKGTYVRPHKHINKSESLHLIEGETYLIFFTPKGAIKEIVGLSEYRNKKRFYCRIPKGLYHNLIIISDWIVFHETTLGPFKRADTVFAPWSPQESDIKAHKAYTRKLSQNIKESKILRRAI